MKKLQRRVTNSELTRLFRNVAAALLLKGANRFRMIAYEKAADAIDQMNRDVYDVFQEGRLHEIGGVGEIIGSNIKEYIETGKVKDYKELFKGIPDTVFALMDVPTIGPKKAYKLVKQFKLKNVDTVFDDLRRIAEEDKIAHLPTFGKRSQELLLKSLDRFKLLQQSNQRMTLLQADSVAQDIVNYLKQLKVVKRIDVLGSLRRRVVTIGDVDISAMVDEKDMQDVINHFVTYPKKEFVDNAGKNKASIILPPHIRVDLRLQNKEQYGSMLQYFTGSKQHNIQLREYALTKGLSLSEWGIKRVKDEVLEHYSTEEAFYERVGLPYVPPEIREGTTEVELARKNKLPKLIELKDIKGDLHTHSNFDIQPSHDLGKDSFEDMMKKAEKLGYEYLGFSDHNPKSMGLTKEATIQLIKDRKDAIEKASSQYPHLKCFVGLEVDILPNGELALPDKALDYLDYVIVSVHSSFNQDRETMTKRVIKALTYPKVRIFAHPTTRLINKREGVEYHWDKIFAASKQNDVAIEINASPDRLDLPDTLVRSAVEEGVKMVINSDAHALDQMDLMPYGITVARRGWVEKKNIVNALSRTDFSSWLLKK